MDEGEEVGAESHEELRQVELRDLPEQVLDVLLTEGHQGHPVQATATNRRQIIEINP